MELIYGLLATLYQSAFIAVFPPGGKGGGGGGGGGGGIEHLGAVYAWALIFLAYQSVGRRSI